MVWLFETYLHNSLGLSLVALLMMAAMSLLAHRYSAKCCYYLWAVFFFALLLPIRPQINIVIPEALRTHIPFGSAQGNTDLSSGISIPVSEVIPIPGTINVWNWMQYAAWLWAAGLIVFIAWHTLQHMRFLSFVRRWSEDIGRVDILELFAHTKSQLDVRIPISIKTCAGIKTPMLVGLLRPMVLLPIGDFNHEELAFILKHELIHYKRKDLWFKVLIMLALALHWFNPVIYLAANSVLTLCEISCDEIVLKEMNAKSRARYGEAIIGVMRNASNRHTSLSTNFYSGKMGIQKRIYAMMDMSTKRFSPLLFLAVLMLTFLGTTTLALTPAQAKGLTASKQGVEVQLTQSTSVPDPDESTAPEPERKVRNLPVREFEPEYKKEYPDTNQKYLLLPHALSYDNSVEHISNLVGLYCYDENGGVLITPEIAEALLEQISNAN